MKDPDASGGSSPASKGEQASARSVASVHNSREDKADPLARRVLGSWLLASEGGPFRVSVWIMASVAALTFVFGQLFLTGDKHEFALAAFCVGVGALLVYAVGMVRTRGGVQRKWRVLRQPLPPDAMDRLRRDLGKVRELAIGALNKDAKGSKFEPSHVRANIFLPDYRHAMEGVAFELGMPMPLRQGMEDPSEWPLRFLPGEGASGRAFQSGDVVLTRDRTHAIPDPHKQEQVNSELEGIVSVPLKDARTGDVLAVLNVDIVKHKVEYSCLERLYDGLTNGEEGNMIRSLAREIARCPTAWLMITLRDG